MSSSAVASRMHQELSLSVRSTLPAETFVSGKMREEEAVCTNWPSILPLCCMLLVVCDEDASNCLFLNIRGRDAASRVAYF